MSDRKSYDVAVVVKQTYVVRVEAVSAVEARVLAGDMEAGAIQRTGRYRGTSIAPSRAFAAPPATAQAREPRPRPPRRVVVGSCCECGADYYDDGTVRHARGCGG